MIKISRIPQFFTLISNLQMSSYTNNFINKMPSIVRLLKILFLFFLILHVMGCTYWRFWIYVDETYFIPESDEVDLCDANMK